MMMVVVEKGETKGVEASRKARATPQHERRIDNKQKKAKLEQRQFKKKKSKRRAILDRERKRQKETDYYDLKTKHKACERETENDFLLKGGGVFFVLTRGAFL